MKFSSYPVVTEPVDSDTFLIHQQSSNSEKQVSLASLASALLTFGSVDTIAALKAIDVTLITNGQQVSVGGYYAGADGGGGQFFYDSTNGNADNGGTVIAPNSGAGRWLRIASPVLNVRQFGAKGDGVTNDFASINAACQAAVAGNTILFPDSTAGYVLSAPVTLSVSQITIQGNGNARVITLNENNFRFFLVPSLFRVVFDGLTFNGGYISTTTGLGVGCVEFSGTSSDCVVRNCYFTKISSSGVYISGNCARITVTECGFNQNFCAIFSDDDTLVQPVNIKITNNTFTTGLGSTSTAFSGAIKFSGTGTEHTKAGHIVSGNAIVNPGQMGIELNNWVNGSTVHGNTVEGAGFGISMANLAKGVISANSCKTCDLAIEVSANSTDCVVSANTVDGRTTGGAISGRYGIVVSASSTKVSVLNNSITGLSTYGIQIDASNAIVCNGNTVKMFNGECVFVHQSYNTIIDGNFLISSGSPDAVYGVDVDVSGSIGGMNGYTITNNQFKGNFSFAIVRFLCTSGTPTVDGVIITGNNTTAATSSGLALDWVLGGASVRNFICKNNRGTSGGDNGQVCLDITIRGIASNTTITIPNVDTYLVDATAGAVSMTLPSAADNWGYEVCLKKSDGSGNAVTIVGTVDGAVNPTLAAQYKYKRVKSNGTNWSVIANN